MALLMIMTLSLLIYATIEHRIRSVLKEADETYPNQKGKPIANPSARWVFQSFSGIHELIVEGTNILILNVKPAHNLLLRLLGSRFLEIYSGNAEFN